MRTFQPFRSVLALGTLLLVASCAMGALVPTARLYLKVSPEGAKTIVPTLTINHYSLKLTSDSGVVVTRDNLN
jgi:hypothetical protein